jgi:hypothetical protein
MKHHQIPRIATAVLSAFLLTGCATYHLTTQSLLQQFANTQKETKVNYIVALPLIFPGTVTGNTLQEIKVLDSNGKEQFIPVTNRTSVRITKRDGKRSTFYFDTLIIQDSTITGKKDHFFGINIKPINLNSIEKIELQR